MIPAATIARLRELESAAPPIPCEDSMRHLLGRKGFYNDDAALIAAALSALPDLLDAAEEAQRLREALTETSERVDRAIQGIGRLRDAHRHGSSEWRRLNGKIDGLAVAGSYLDEHLRILAAPTTRGDR